ncbi:MAG: Ig-like domain-containing protein, partial [Pseudomonadota bacterium]
MPTYSERSNKTLLTGATDPDNDPITVASVNGSAANLGVPVALTGGAGGTVLVAPDGSVTLNDATLTAPLVGTTVIAGTFTYTLTDGVLESATYTATIEATGTAGLPAGFSAGQWSVSDTGLGGVLDISIGQLPDDGGTALTNIEVRVDGGAWVQLAAANAGTFPLTGMPNNQPVGVELRVANAIGAGPSSDLKT